MALVPASTERGHKVGTHRMDMSRPTCLTDMRAGMRTGMRTDSAYGHVRGMCPHGTAGNLVVDDCF